MNPEQIIRQFYDGMLQTSVLEYIAVFAGIASVWFSRIENILVYPVGLINTIIYIYLSFNQHLLGEASVNFYYTVMSIYGWILWTRKDKQHHFAAEKVVYGGEGIVWEVECPNDCRGQATVNFGVELADRDGGATVVGRWTNPRFIRRR